MFSSVSRRRKLSRSFAAESLEQRIVPSPTSLLPATTQQSGQDGNDLLIVNNGDGSDFIQQETSGFFAFPTGFAGGVRVATGDVTGDGTPDIITGSFTESRKGPVFDLEFGNGPNLPAFSGGIFVAGSDVSGDGNNGVIVGPGPGGRPHVRVFGPTQSTNSSPSLNSFFAFEPGFTGGVRVASGDVNGDGFDDIIVGSGSSRQAPEIPFDFDRLLGPSPQGFLAGVFVAAGDVSGDGFDDIITGAGPGGGPRVHVIGGGSNEFFVFDDGFGLRSPSQSGQSAGELPSTFPLTQAELDGLFIRPELLVPAPGE